MVLAAVVAVVPVAVAGTAGADIASATGSGIHRWDSEVTHMVPVCAHVTPRLYYGSETLLVSAAARGTGPAVSGPAGSTDDAGPPTQLSEFGGRVGGGIAEVVGASEAADAA